MHAKETATSFAEEYRRTVLSISPVHTDHEALRSALNVRIWHVDEASNYPQAVAYLCRKRMDIIVCEYHLAGGSWRDLLSHLAAMPEAPPLIVTTESANERLREEVRNLGGQGVLAKPFDSEEVRRVLTAVWQDHAARADVLV